MKKNTQDKVVNDYKEAIRKKYKSERLEGKHSHYLSNPSQALLRDLCWEIFILCTKPDDLAVYHSFFKSEFNPAEDTSIEHTNKFKKIGAFLRGGIEPAKFSTVELAAILVDFEPRPINKFRKFGESEEKDQTNSSNNSEPLGNSEEEKEHDKIPQSLTGIDGGKKESEDTDVQIADLSRMQKLIDLLIGFKEKVCQMFTKKMRWTMFAILLVFALGFLISHYIFPRKQCMQWNKDHYDIVDCNLEVNGILTPNMIEPLDESRVNLLKLKVCDTTTYFKNGQPIVFYAKNDGIVTSFNQMGQNPEKKGQYLRPVTDHIIEKYLRNKPCK